MCTTRRVWPHHNAHRGQWHISTTTVHTIPPAGTRHDIFGKSTFFFRICSRIEFENQQEKAREVGIQGQTWLRIMERSTSAGADDLWVYHEVDILLGFVGCAFEKYENVKGF